MKRGTLTLPAGAEKRLRIENVAGRVEVVPGGPDTVAEYVIYARGEDKENARRRAEAVAVACGGSKASGNRIWAAAADGERWPPGVSVELVVSTPPDRNVSAKVVSAHVSLDGMQGRTAVDAVSGDVSVRNAAGPVAARAVSGDICVDSAGGPVEAGTTSGHIQISAKRGDQIRGSSVSGDIAIEVAEPFSGHIRSESVSGEVAIALPAESDCRLRATTMSGTISGTLWPADTQRARREVRGRLGRGTGSLEISTTSGDIRLNAQSRGGASGELLQFR